MKTNKIVSLFSGAMGLDLGLEQSLVAGQDPFETVVCADNEESCRETIRKNRPKIQVLGDVKDVTRANVNRSVCIVSGGPPCQSWSTAGRRKGFGDPRGSLILEFGRVVRELRPRFFIMENVRGLMSMTTDDGKKAIDMLLKEFEDIGYKTVHGILDAVDFGTPQFRERLIVIGSRDSEGVFLPLPTHFQQHQVGRFRWRTLGDAIGPCSPRDFEGIYVPVITPLKHEHLEFSPKRKGWLEKIPEGGNWKNLSEEDQQAAMGNAIRSGGGKTGFFRRLSMAEPSPTLVTSPVQKSTTLCHPKKTRPLSVEEYSAIQTFPLWEITGTTPEKYRQLGNAVPPLLGKAIGDMLMSVMQGDRHTVKTARRRAGKERKKTKRVSEDDEPKIFWGDDDE